MFKCCKNFLQRWITVYRFTQLPDWLKHKLLHSSIFFHTQCSSIHEKSDCMKKNEQRINWLRINARYEKIFMKPYFCRERFCLSFLLNFSYIFSSDRFRLPKYRSIFVLYLLDIVGWRRDICWATFSLN